VGAIGIDTGTVAAGLIDGEIAGGMPGWSGEWL